MKQEQTCSTCKHAGHGNHKAGIIICHHPKHKHPTDPCSPDPLERIKDFLANCKDHEFNQPPNNQQ